MGSELQMFEARVGNTIAGKWKLERLIGVGGMAAVYAAKHHVGTHVAIKILHPEVARRTDLRERFEREARVMGMLAHPGAVEVRDIDVSPEGEPFIVMELLEGESLKDRLERLGEIPVDDLLRYADEALDVLAAAHAEGIVHRDIKLDNLFITTAGGLKVLDFGVARMRDGQPMTQVGTRLGTLPYMPPEQVLGKDIDGRADLFAVGAVMFRAITKRRVHEVRTESEMVMAMSTRPAPPLAEIAPNVPDALCKIVDCALAFSSDRRYPDAATMQADIRALRQSQAPGFATRTLTELGPPNPNSSASPSPLPVQVAGPTFGTSITKVETPRRSDVAVGAVAAVSATAAATPFESVPVSSTALAPPASAAQPLGLPLGLPLGSQKAVVPMDTTRVSPGAPMVGAGVGVSVGVEHAAPGTDPMPRNDLIDLGAAGIIPGAAPVTTVMPPREDDHRKQRKLIAIVASAGIFTVMLILGLVVWASSGSGTDEQETRSADADDDTDDSDEDEAGDDGDGSATDGNDGNDGAGDAPAPAGAKTTTAKKGFPGIGNAKPATPGQASPPPPPPPKRPANERPTNERPKPPKKKGGEKKGKKKKKSKGKPSKKEN